MNKLKLLLIDNDINDTIKSVHIVSNKQATYICPLHCKASDNIYDMVFQMLMKQDFHIKAVEKWFDTGDYEWFELTTLSINAYDLFDNYTE